MLDLTPCFKLACRCSPVKCRETSAVAVLRAEELLSFNIDIELWARAAMPKY